MATPRPEPGPRRTRRVPRIRPGEPRARGRRWRVSGTDPEGQCGRRGTTVIRGLARFGSPEAWHTGTPVRFTSYPATTRMRRSRSNVFHSARESAYAAGQRHSLRPHTQCTYARHRIPAPRHRRRATGRWPGAGAPLVAAVTHRVGRLWPRTVTPPRYRRPPSGLAPIVQAAHRLSAYSA